MTLDEVASRAGMTKGAIYGNFKNKDDLIMAVVLARWDPVVPELKPGAPLKAQLRIMAETMVKTDPERRLLAARRLIAFHQYAQAHPEMRALVARENREIYRRIEEWLLRFVSADELPMPPATFVRVIHALSDGLLITNSLTPELITRDVVIAAFEALAPAGRGDVG